MAEKKPDQSRGFMSLALIIVAGIIIGDFLKNVEIGLIIGLGLGLLGGMFIKRR